ncbi:hypothetical protein [Salinimonas lutimaris]|uniref:hypothetical protein n=1 Tax=Salinimonas lutimaris TaxID=914153 RepID=UPI0010C030D4|nr:hypothetical protein [Salinimonas lutimaris]
MNITGYPRTGSKKDNQRNANHLTKRINKLLSKGVLTESELEELIQLLGGVIWSHGALSYRLKALRAAHELRDKILKALKKHHNEQLSDENQYSSAGGLSATRIREFEQQLQVATLLIGPSNDSRSVVEKLNQPIADSPDFTPYSFQEITRTDHTVYYCDIDGDLLRVLDLEHKTQRQLEKDEALLAEVLPPKKTSYIDDDERARLEAEVDNLNTLSDDTRQTILNGWQQGNITHIDQEFPELENFNKCVSILDDLGVMFGTYEELKSGEFKTMFNKNGYQAEHYPPLSTLLARAVAQGEARGAVPRIDGIVNYTEKQALCFAVFDGQSKGFEHYNVTRAAEAFMKSLAEKGEKATLGQWLDKAVDYYAKEFTKRLEREAVEPFDKPALAKQGRKAAVAIRNVTRAHFIALDGKDVLDLPLENGKYRNKKPQTFGGNVNEL